MTLYCNHCIPIKSTMFVLMEPLACQAFHLTCPGGMCHMLKGCVFRLQQALAFGIMFNNNVMLLLLLL